MNSMNKIEEKTPSMGRIDTLINELCPEGVEFVDFFDVCDFIRGVTYNKSQEAKTTHNAHKVLRANNITLHLNTLNFDDVKLVSNDVVVKTAQHLCSGDILMCVGSGSKEHIGKVAYIKEDMDYTFGGFMAVVRCKSCIKPRFMFHILAGNIFSRHLEREINSTTINNINKQVMQSLEIPLPPLPIQEEIVKILDTFTELQAELQARLLQYQYYRDQLLSFDGREDIKWKKLGEVCEFKNGFAFKSNLFRNDGLPIVRITNITGQGVDMDDAKYFHMEDYPKTNMSVYAINDGDVLVAMSGATTGKIATYRERQTAYLNQRTGKFVPSQVLNNRFLFHFLLTQVNQMYVMAGGGAQPNLSSNDLKTKIEIPLPPLEEQERIASILDRFDTLVNDLSQGLPAEIEARRQQYEYYRDKLLIFKRKEA